MKNINHGIWLNFAIDEYSASPEGKPAQARSILA
jgi:hypothetical protein